MFIKIIFLVLLSEISTITFSISKTIVRDLETLFLITPLFGDIFLIIYELTKKSFCKNSQKVIIIHSLFWLPNFLLNIRYSLSMISTFVSIISSILLFIIFCLGFGCFDLTNWYISIFFVSIIIISPICFSKCRYYSIFTIIGLICGCIPFLLDWPICWKEPPSPHCFLMIIGSIIGSLIDLHEIYY